MHPQGGGGSAPKRMSDPQLSPMATAAEALNGHAARGGRGSGSEAGDRARRTGGSGHAWGRRPCCAQASSRSSVLYVRSCASGLSSWSQAQHWLGPHATISSIEPSWATSAFLRTEWCGLASSSTTAASSALVPAIFDAPPPARVSPLEERWDRVRPLTTAPLRSAPLRQ